MKTSRFIFSALFFLLIKLAWLSGQPTFQDIDRAMAARDYREALRLCSLNEAGSGTSPELSLRYGIINASLSNHQTALTHLAAAEKAGSGGVAAGLLIAECLEALGDIEAASGKYEELIGNNNANLFLINSYARMLVSNRKFHEAARWYQILVDSVPDNPVFRKNLGGCLIQANMDNFALIHLREAWRLNNKDLSVLMSLSNTWLRLRMPQAGIETVEEAVANNSRHPLPYRCHGNLLFALQSYKPASEAYLNAYNLGDTSMVVIRQLAFSLYASQQFREAIPYLKIYYEADTLNHEAAYYLGIAMSSWRMQNEGIEYLEKAIALMMPDSARLGGIYASIGKACSDINRYDKGIESYLTALTYEPKNPDHLLNLAKMYDGSKNLREALKYFEAYDAHQTEMIRRIAESRGMETDKFIMSGNQNYARLRIKKIKEDLFFLGEIQKINS